MSWKAIHPGHAIERVRLVVGFSGSIPEKISHKMALDFRSKLTDLNFGGVKDKQVHEVRLGPSNFQSEFVAPVSAGWQAERQAADGRVAEVLDFDLKSLTYETADYSGWTGFKSRFEEVALSSLDAANSVVDLSSLTIEYIDRFVADADDQIPAPTELIVGLDNWLPPSALSGQESWHLHRGWFEIHDGLKILVNQDLDAQVGSLQSGELIHSVCIYTKIQVSGLQQEVEFDILNPILEVMHTRAVSIFGSALTDDAKKSVGIGV